MTTLDEARDALMVQAENGGGICPCCNQRAQVYRRQIYAPMAAALCRLYWLDQQPYPPANILRVGRYFHLSSLSPVKGGDPIKLKFWDLIRKLDGQREDGSGRVGLWAITDLGRAYVEGRSTQPKYALVYADTLLEFQGPPRTIKQALGGKYDHAAVMAGR